MRWMLDANVWPQTKWALNCLSTKHITALLFFILLSSASNRSLKLLRTYGVTDKGWKDQGIYKIGPSFADCALNHSGVFWNDVLRWWLCIMIAHIMYQGGKNFVVCQDKKKEVSGIGSLLSQKALKREDGKEMKNTMAWYLTWKIDCRKNGGERKMRLHWYDLRRHQEEKERQRDIVLRVVAYCDNNNWWQ